MLISNDMSLFNYYYKHGLINGDLCITELRHDEYIREKIKGINHNIILKNDEKYKNKHSIKEIIHDDGYNFTIINRPPNREFVWISNCKLIKRDGKLYLNTVKYSDIPITLIKEDPFFSIKK